MNNVYLVSTAHLEKSLWFKDDDDFKVGMNYVAIQAAECPTVEVMSFALMSNHVHFVFCGLKEKVMEFVNHFKHRYAVYLRHKYGTGAFLKRNHVDVRLIPYDNESVEWAIAYVQMNPVAANISLHPTQYPWGSGNTFFSPSGISARRLSDLSVREKRRMFHTNADSLPGTWQVSPDGYILPRSYVAVAKVESLYRTPKRMNYFLTMSSKARKKLEAGENLPAFRDQTILSAIPDLCRSLFQKGSVPELSDTEKSEMARQIRYRFSADANQIARVCGMGYADTARLLDEGCV